jgi:polysaccharide biosynthesis protein PslH
MRVLQVCPKPPIPPVDGGCIAMLATSKAISAQGHSLKIFSAETKKHPISFNEDFKDIIAQTQFESCFVDTSIHPVAALLSVFSGKSYNVSRFETESFRQKLIEILQNNSFDVVQLESIYVAPYIEEIRKHSPNSKIVIRTHNVEFFIWKRLAVEVGRPKSLYLNFLSKRLKNFEISALSRADAIASISPDDTDIFKSLLPNKHIETIPVNIEVSEIIQLSSKRNLLFLGSFDWKPNAEGIERFLSETWPELIKAIPELSLHIAGRKMPLSLQKRIITGVKFLGEVKDKQEFFTEGNIFIAPVYSGSGVRIKILEAMALGKTVITTPLGAEGLGGISGSHYFVGRSTSEFVDIIKELWNNPGKCAEVGQNAHTFVKEKFSESSVGSRFTKLYEQISAHAVKV